MRYLWRYIILCLVSFVFMPHVAEGKEGETRSPKSDMLKSPTLRPSFQPGDLCSILINLNPDLISWTISSEHAMSFDLFCRLDVGESCDDYNDIFPPEDGWLLQNQNTEYCSFIPYRTEDPISPKALDGIDPCKFYRQYYGIGAGESCAVIYERFNISATKQ